MKKKLVILGSAAMLSLALAGSLGAVVASAATEVTNGKGENTTKVTYQVADSWKITIPESITVGGDGGTIKAEEVKIRPNYTLKVTVSSANGFSVQDSGKKHSIAYDLKTQSGGTALEEGGTVLEVEAGTTSGQDTLTATVKEGNGNYSTGNEEYTDTLSFTVSAEDNAA